MYLETLRLMGMLQSARTARGIEYSVYRSVATTSATEPTQHTEPTDYLRSPQPDVPL